MDGQKMKETIPPVATRPLEDLSTSAKHGKLLNRSAPEWFAKSSDRDIRQTGGSLNQFVQ